MTSQSSPITARAPTLAPTTVDVRSCHAGSSSLESSPLTASDSSRGRPASDGSAQERGDLAGEELQVLEIGHVEELQIDPLHTGFDERAQPVGDLRGRADGG